MNISDNSKWIVNFTKHALISGEKNSTLTIKAYKAKHEKCIYWYVGCDIDSALKSLGMFFDRDFEYHPRDDIYQNVEVRRPNKAKRCPANLKPTISKPVLDLPVLDLPVFNLPVMETSSLLPKYYFWGIVADNELMHTMFKFLCMSDDELMLVSGATHPVEYRFMIIKTLDAFWE